MLKRIFGAAFVLSAFLFASLPAIAAGSVQLSMSQQFDAQGRPLSGGKLYFFQSGTTTPQSAYQDTALTLAHPNPITLDASGRVPVFYLADGFIKIRLTDSTGVNIIAADGILVIGPSSGGGGGGSVDATTILATGDVKSKYGTGTLTGFVRLNGRTIGSASSGASERANADVQALFEYLWTADANLSVSGGRGASANADWLANKALTLPDFRGRMPAAMCDMGNSDSGRLTSTYFGASCTTLGAAGGAESFTIAQGNLPNITLVTTITDPGHTHALSNPVTFAGPGTVGGSPNNIVQAGAASTQSATTGITASTALGGSGTSMAKVQPTILVTYYVKL